MTSTYVNVKAFIRHLCCYRRTSIFIIFDRLLRFPSVVNCLFYFHQRQLDMDIDVRKSGQYVFVVQYYHDAARTHTMDVYLRTYRDTQRGDVILSQCK